MLKLLLMVLLAVLVTACISEPPESPPEQAPQWHMNPILTPTVHASGLVEFEVDGLRVGITKPENWELFPTEEGILISENVGGIEQVGILHGMFVYLWVPRLDEMHLLANTRTQSSIYYTDTTVSAINTNRAWRILNGVIAQPGFIGDANAATPVAFTWDHHEAAYYLANERNQKLMIVIGVMLPQGQMIACTIAAPASSAETMREALLELLATLQIEGHVFEPAVLESTLPDPLLFPAYRPLNTTNAP